MSSKSRLLLNQNLIAFSQKGNRTIFFMFLELDLSRKINLSRIIKIWTMKIEIQFAEYIEENIFSLILSNKLANASSSLIKWVILLIRTWDVAGSHWVVGGRRWSRSLTQENCVRRCDSRHMGHVLEEEDCTPVLLELEHEILQKQLNLFLELKNDKKISPFSNYLKM